MKRRIAILILLPVVLLLSATAPADESKEARAVRAALAKVLPHATPDQINPTPVNGLYEVVVGPQLFYVTADGNYLIQGSVIDLKERRDLTGERRDTLRRDAVNGIGEDKMVIFAPEHPRHTITVFTDLDCTYCRKLHSQIGQYNANGIAVRYLLYPRSGVDTPSYYKAVSVWCAKDRNDALTRAKAGEEMPRADCDNPVKEHLAMGEMIGVSGTPAIVLEDGTLVPGYVPPLRLAQMLDGQAKASLH
jgi:thiol:disulfide interchange protein DsbC